MARRFRVLLYTVLIILFSATVIEAGSITGNPKVDWLIEHGYVKGDSNGYRLYDRINRAETTKLVVEAAGLKEYVDSFKHLDSKFNDVNKSHWANGHINAAVINKLLDGYTDGSFKPSNDITYAEVIKLLVMVKGNLPTDTDKYSGSIWAIPYIVKADEVGITEGVNILQYYEPATRQMVFEMVFNTLFEEEPLVLEEYKGIVMENHRVANLDDDEVSLVVIEDLNKESETKPRYERDDKIKLRLPEKVEDVEYLMGKVVDITIDNNNVVTDVEVDKSYSYMEGPILAYEDEVYNGVNGRYYKINGDLQVYHNDADYKYNRYVDRLGDYDNDDELSFLAEFANVTTKNGRIYFLDSFTFTDIAPVEDVSRNNEITIYDDSRNAKLGYIYIDNVISYNYDQGFDSIKNKNIREWDVVHIYDETKAIVRKDSKFKGYLNDLFEYKGYYFAEIDDELYQIRITKDKRPVYSIDGETFKTLYAEDFYELEGLIGKTIVYILDINGHIQGILDAGTGTLSTIP